MNFDVNNLDNKSNQNNNGILLDMVKDLQEIVDYTQENLLKRKEKDKKGINLNEGEILNEVNELTYNKNKKTKKLRRKRKNDISDENNFSEDTNINLENKRENIDEDIEKIGNEIIKRIIDIITKINSYNNNKIKEQKSKKLNELIINI